MLKTSTAGILLLIVFSFSSTYSQTFDPTPLEGSWRGIWLNLTFSTTDSAFLNIDVDEINNTISMVLDLDGGVFGGPDPDPATMTGTYDQNGFSVTGTSPTYGDMFFAGDAAGFISGRMPNVPNPSIDSTTLSGTYTIQLISLGYLVYFTGGGGTANGIINIYKDSTATEVEQLSESPKDFHLYQNYPNPFNPSTKIRFDLPSSGYTSLKVYDMLGREIAELVNEELSAGSYEFTWNAQALSSGIYFYELKTKEYSLKRKMMLIK
jgi:hypothetical protein